MASSAISLSLKAKNDGIIAYMNTISFWDFDSYWKLEDSFQPHFNFIADENTLILFSKLVPLQVLLCNVMNSNTVTEMHYLRIFTLLEYEFFSIFQLFHHVFTAIHI